MLNSRLLIAIIAVVALIDTTASHVTLHAQDAGYHEVLQFGPTETTGMFFSLAYSLDSQWLAVGTYLPHTIEIRSATTGKIVKILTNQSEQGSQTIPIWSPDGQYIAEIDTEVRPSSKPQSVIQDGRAYIWDVKTGKRTEISTRNDAGSKYADAVGNIGISYVAWHPNGKELLIMDNDRKLRLLDFPSGKLLWIISPYVDQPSRFATADTEFPCPPQWNPSGSRFVCIGDGVQGVFDGATGHHLFDVQHEIGLDSYPQWTQDGKYILNVDIGDGGNTFSIDMWDANTGARANLPPKTGFPFSVSPDSTRIAYVDVVTHEIVVAALKTDDILARLALDYSPGVPAPTWSADGHYLAVIDWTSTIHVFTDKSSKF